MPAFIVSELASDDDGTLLETVEDAETALKYMQMNYDRKRFSIREKISFAAGKRRYSIFERSRRPMDIFYVREKFSIQIE